MSHTWITNSVVHYIWVFNTTIYKHYSTSVITNSSLSEQTSVSILLKIVSHTQFLLFSLTLSIAILTLFEMFYSGGVKKDTGWENTVDFPIFLWMRSRYIPHSRNNIKDVGKWLTKEYNSLKFLLCCITVDLKLHHFFLQVMHDTQIMWILFAKTEQTHLHLLDVISHVFQNDSYIQCK